LPTNSSRLFFNINTSFQACRTTVSSSRSPSDLSLSPSSLSSTRIPWSLNLLTYSTTSFIVSSIVTRLPECLRSILLAISYPLPISYLLKSMAGICILSLQSVFSTSYSSRSRKCHQCQQELCKCHVFQR